MIVGVVREGTEAVISLAVRGPTGGVESIDAVIGTGFSGYLTLTPATIVALGLPLLDSEQVVLADGSRVELRMFLAGVEWNGRIRWDIATYETGGTPLVGMALLRDCRLMLDVIDGGRVTIEPITGQATPPAEE